MNQQPSVSLRGYIPAQPNFQTGSEYYVEYVSKHPSFSIPILYYQFRSSSAKGGEITAIPDGFVDIMFQCNPDQPFARVYGTVLEMKDTGLEAGQDYFGVRLIPFYEPKAASVRMKEIVDKHVPLSSLVPSQPEFIASIIHATSFAARIELFQAYLERTLFPQSPATRLVQHVLGRICSSKGSAKMSELAEETAYSERYIRKQFEEYVGLSPKHFGQITRFQHALHMLRTQPNSMWDVITQTGYYDQAHFINEFKKLSHATPNQWKVTFM